MIVLAVDDVARAAAPAATVSLAEHLGPHLYLGVDGAVPVLPVRGVAPLLAAVHHAFAEHRPLVLSPDAVWLTIAQGVAHHVRLHADALRSRLVRHDGRRMLTVWFETVPDSAADWAAIIDAFRGLIADDLGAGLARLMSCDFSTSGLAERVASEIVLMDAVSSYYDYTVACVCGIPEITLTGTAADWRAIRARIDVIAELDLGWWTASLLPLLDRLVAAADGRPDPAFFRAIYKPRAAYGWDRITGWIARLYPYVGQGGSYTERNPLLAFALDAEVSADDGIRSQDAPAAPSQVLVRVEVDSAMQVVVLEGGLLAVEQDGEGRLVPRAGYLLRIGEGTVQALVDRMTREHRVFPGSGSPDPRWDFSAELKALLAAIDEATLFASTAPWRLLPPANRDRIELAVERAATADRLVDLADGSCLAVLDSRAGLAVLRLDVAALVPRPPDEWVLDETTGLTIAAHGAARAAQPRWRTTQAFASIPVIGSSLLAVLLHALQHDGALPRPVADLLDVEPALIDTPEHAAALLDRLARDHHVVRAVGSQRGHALGVVEASFTVGGQRWTLPRTIEVERVVIGVDDDRLLARCVVCTDEGAWLAVVESWPRRGIVLLPAGTIVTEQVAKRRGGPRRGLTRCTAPTSSIPVLGRSLVEIIVAALDEGALPAPTATVADWLARSDDPP
jgi:hypothetical protein